MTTFKAMLYTEIKLPTFVHATNGANMGQTQTASTIETTATTPRELLSKHRLTAEEAEQIEAVNTSSLVELLEVMPFPKTLNLYSAEGAVQNFGTLRATST